MMTFDRFTMKTGKRVIVKNLVATVRGGRTIYRGFEVNGDGEEPTPQHLHLFTDADVARRVALRVNLKYDTFEPTTDDNRMPFHPDKGDGRATR